MFRLTVRELGVAALMAAALVIGLVVYHFRHREGKSPGGEADTLGGSEALSLAPAAMVRDRN